MAGYPLPADSTGASAMALDSDGNVWLIQDSPPVLYKLVKENMTFSRYSLKGFEGAGFTGLSVDESGRVWFADMKGNRVGAYTEADNHTATFDFPGPMAPSSVICRGHYLWIGAKEEVGELDLNTGEFYDHFVYKMDSYLYDIHFDRMGNVWFVENYANKVGVYFRTYDRVSEFPIPTEDSYPTCLDIDSQGRLWFVESAPNKIGMYHTELFNFSEVNLTPVDGKMPTISRIAVAGDGVWVTDMKHGRLLKYYPEEQRFAAAELGNGTTPTLIQAEWDKSLWVYETGNKRVSHVVLSPEFGVPTPAPEPTATPTPTAIPAPTPLPTPTSAPGSHLVLLAIVFGISIAMRKA